MNELIIWLEGRINKLELEKENSLFMDVKLAKGAKAKGFKECLDYIKTHGLDETLR